MRITELWVGLLPRCKESGRNVLIFIPYLYLWKDHSFDRWKANSNRSSLILLLFLLSIYKIVTNLFRKQTVHHEEHHTLKTSKNGEQISHGNCALLKLETPKDPHCSQYAQLGNCSDGKCPVGGNKNPWNHFRVTAMFEDLHFNGQTHLND